MALWLPGEVSAGEVSRGGSSGRMRKYTLTCSRSKGVGDCMAAWLQDSSVSYGRCVYRDDR